MRFKSSHSLTLATSRSFARHDSEDCGVTIRMLLSKVWWIYSDQDAQRRCVFRATVGQVHRIKDILDVLHEARSTNMLPARGAVMTSRIISNGLLAITNGELGQAHGGSGVLCLRHRRRAPPRSGLARGGSPPRDRLGAARRPVQPRSRARRSGRPAVARGVQRSARQPDGAMPRLY